MPRRRQDVFSTAVLVTRETECGIPSKALSRITGLGKTCYNCLSNPTFIYATISTLILGTAVTFLSIFAPIRPTCRQLFLHTANLMFTGYWSPWRLQVQTVECTRGRQHSKPERSRSCWAWLHTCYRCAVHVIALRVVLLLAGLSEDGPMAAFGRRHLRDLTCINRAGVVAGDEQCPATLRLGCSPSGCPGE